MGKVFLVGAGPGDPGLITLRGQQCIRLADVVLYDYLASPELLLDARPGAELICLGRHGQGRLMSQAEINAAMVRHARAGRTVVRLKGGDATIFARLAEEMAALAAAGICYEVVPGITTAQAASSHGGFPLTQRDDASCVAFVTGQETRDKETPLDYAALAKFPGTLVFYMGVTTAPVWSRALMAEGKRADTPVSVVRHCSLNDQETLHTTLGELSDVLRERKLRPPAIIIVGEVARQTSARNWFTSRPLFGRSVLVTRPRHQSREFARRLSGLGAQVFFQPAIDIGPPLDWSAVDDVIARLAEFDWLVFMSANGVQYFFDRLRQQGYDARRLGAARIAAIGPATADSLAGRQLLVDVQAAEYRAESLGESLLPLVRGRRVFVSRASRGREVLADMLEAAGAQVEQAVVYESRDVVAPEAEVAKALAAGSIDWTTVTSSAIARNLARMFGESLRQTRLAAISPVTAETLAELGFEPAVVAEAYTTEGLLAAMVAAEVGKL